MANRTFLANEGRPKENPGQYGSGGNLLGKKFMVCGTWNAPKEAFGDIDQKLFRGKKTEDLFLHITSSYLFVVAKLYPITILLTYLEVKGWQKTLKIIQNI